MFQDGSGGGPTDSPPTLCRQGSPQSVPKTRSADTVAQSLPVGRPGRARRPKPTAAPRSSGRIGTGEAIPARAEAHAYHPRRLLTAREPVVALCPRKVHTADARPAPGESQRSPARRGRAAFRAEDRGPTLRIHPFTSRRFHVLLNSLFKVLFNFPSRYLSAIGLVPVFSLRWSLPPALGCIPKQPDSGDARSRRTSDQQRPDTRSGRGPDQEDFGHRRERQLASHTPQFPPAACRGIRCWADPASLAVTGGILVSFFSSA